MRLYRRLRVAPRPAPRVCVLASGGVDSAVLMAEFLRRGCVVHPLYVRSGYRWETAEIHWLKRYMRALKSTRLRPLTTADLPLRGLLNGHWGFSGRGVPSASSPWERVHLPGRNVMLLSQAGFYSSLRRIPLVAYGVLKGNPFRDATPFFLKSMERTLRLGLGIRLRIVAPYRDLSKAQVVRRLKGLPLHLTFSCLRPLGLRHCGRCSKCSERAQCLRQ